MRKINSPYKDPLVAGLVGIIPGAGHIYCGEHLRGVTYLAGTLAGLFLFVVPGVFIWAASIPDVVLCVRRRNLLARPLMHASAMVSAPALAITDGPDPDCPALPIPEDPLPLEPTPESDPSPRSPR